VSTRINYYSTKQEPRPSVTLGHHWELAELPPCHLQTAILFDFLIATYTWTHQPSRVCFYCLLLQAIALGLLWQLPSSSTKELTATPGPLIMPFQHSPDAIKEQDSQTCLYPFQSAATMPYCEMCPSEEEDTLSLNTIYYLLQLSPELIHGLIMT
jgi:hypothetical protein